MTLSVNEIFYSIQGESTHSGRPCVFIRLAGCNLRCQYCDTTYAYDPGTEMQLPEVIEKVQLYSCSLIEITGGEPLLQPQTPQLISQLMTAGFEVLLETNGSLDIRPVDPKCTRIVDIKCPSSKESHQNRLDNLKYLTPRDQIKFVMSDRNDYEFAKTILSGPVAHRLTNHHILFSPVKGMLSAAVLAGWILADHLAVRLQVQLHTIIWPDVNRGR
ncbi:MAG: radical SAM protein [Deltaproteobacteria bacterium]|nr:radical SAM protein [Deltaproteobacteria bacterium]